MMQRESLSFRVWRYSFVRYNPPMKIRNLVSIVFVFSVVWTHPWSMAAQVVEPAKNIKYAQISPDEMKEWLTYLASDELTGRRVFTEGYGLAAQYVSERLKQWGIKPLGTAGTYLQPMKLTGYKVTRNSTVTVDVNGQSTTFKHGEHVSFPANGGGKQTLTFNGIEFLGYGRPADFQGRDVKGKLVLTMPNLSAAGTGARGGRGGGGNSGFGALISFIPTPPAPSAAERAVTSAAEAVAQAQTALTQAQQELRGGRGTALGFGGRGGRGGALPAADFTSAQRIDLPVAPQIAGDETFYQALLGSSAFTEIKAKAEKGEPLPPASYPGKVTVNIDNTYEIVSQQIGHNVAGMIEGTDPRLKDSYVMFSAHLDHIGYSETGASALPSPTGCRNRSPEAQAAVVAAGKVVQKPSGRGAAAAPAGGGRGGRGAADPTPFLQRDVISNGADDDGSGSTSLLAVAKAFASGPKPKRSVVFLWHTGEEAGLLGSRYNADFPVVPINKIEVDLNMDMVGRDDCDDIEGDYRNTLFVVGADRISTDLHNLIVMTNNTLPKPLALDYELNDPNDPESVYTRSDHYSYAAKGVPIAFFTTGLHPDYHRVSDTVDKIIFPKMARIAQLVYETGFSVANTDHILERDNKGPRTGFGSKAELIKP